MSQQEVASRVGRASRNGGGRVGWIGGGVDENPSRAIKSMWEELSLPPLKHAALRRGPMPHS